MKTLHNYRYEKSYINSSIKMKIHYECRQNRDPKEGHAHHNIEKKHGIILVLRNMATDLDVLKPYQDHLQQYREQILSTQYTQQDLPD